MSPGLQLQADIRIAAGTGLVWARPELEVDVFFMNLNNLSLINLVTKYFSLGHLSRHHGLVESGVDEHGDGEDQSGHQD